MRIRKICYVVTIPTTIRSFFMSQLQYLAKHGFDVSVICARDEKLLEDMGNGIHYIPLIYTWYILWGLDQSSERIDKYI